MRLRKESKKKLPGKGQRAFTPSCRMKVRPAVPFKGEGNWPKNKREKGESAKDFNKKLYHSSLPTTAELLYGPVKRSFKAQNRGRGERNS